MTRSWEVGNETGYPLWRETLLQLSVASQGHAGRDDARMRNAGRNYDLAGPGYRSLDSCVYKNDGSTSYNFFIVTSVYTDHVKCE